MKLFNTSQKLIKPRMTINLMIGKNVEIGRPDTVKVCDHDISNFCEILSSPHGWTMGNIVDPIGIPAPENAGFDEDVDRLTFWKLVATNDVE